MRQSHSNKSACAPSYSIWYSVTQQGHDDIHRENRDICNDDICKQETTYVGRHVDIEAHVDIQRATL